MTRICSTYGKEQKTHIKLDGRHERTSFERAKDRFRRIIDNISIEFKDLVHESVDWIHLIWDRVQWQVLVNSKEP